MIQNMYSYLRKIVLRYFCFSDTTNISITKTKTILLGVARLYHRRSIQSIESTKLRRSNQFERTREPNQSIESNPR